MPKLFDRKFGDNFLGSVPATPGVYRYLDAAREVIYVGKAIRLRRRLQQYRNAQRLKKHRKMREILRAAASIEFTLCSDHQEACLLELEQIQTLRPRFNVASAYSFLYPYIGVRFSELGVLELFLTTRPQLIASQEGISWHGSFRSRRWSREFFQALEQLLTFVAHPSGPARRRLHRIEGVWSIEFRAVPKGLGDRLQGFLRGEKESDFMSELVLLLVENAGARARRSHVQHLVEICDSFWQRECQPLLRARDFSGVTAYPVPQDKRDELFLKFRLSRSSGGTSGRG